MFGDCPLADVMAQRLRDSRDDLTRRWLDRITARVSLEPERMFPTEDLLDHVPLLVDGIADYLANPADEIAGDMPVMGKAMELGELRHSQGFDAYQILKEYEILGGILVSFLSEIADGIDAPCTRKELLQCAGRVFHAVALIQQVTTTHFLRKIGEQVREREERLRRFNRMVSHELKNRIGAIKGAHALMTEPWLAAEERERFQAMIGENVAGIETVLENLTALSRLDARVVQHRHVLLAQAVRESMRQLRELARTSGVVVRIEGDLPRVDVDAAAVELCLSNYLTNAIKYADRAKGDRWVAVSAEVRERDDHGHAELVVRTRDNGIGIPPESRARLFERFFRAPEATVTGVEGTGLGLSLVRETVEAVGGRAWVESTAGNGSEFFFTLPCRRQGESPAGQRVVNPRATESATSAPEAHRR